MSSRSLSLATTILVGSILPLFARARGEGEKIPLDGAHLMKINVRATAKTYRRTEPVVIEIDLKNLSDHTLISYRFGKAHTLFIIEATDEHGEKMPDTRYDGEGRMGSLVTEGFQGGKGNRWKLHLDSLKDLTEPGTYAVTVQVGFRVSKVGFDKPFVVRSQPITIRILDEPKDSLPEYDKAEEGAE